MRWAGARLAEAVGAGGSLFGSGGEIVLELSALGTEAGRAGLGPAVVGERCDALDGRAALVAGPEIADGRGVQGGGSGGGLRRLAGVGRAKGDGDGRADDGDGHAEDRQDGTGAGRLLDRSRCSGHLSLLSPGPPAGHPVGAGGAFDDRMLDRRRPGAIGQQTDAEESGCLKAASGSTLPPYRGGPSLVARRHAWARNRQPRNRVSLNDGRSTT